MSGSLGDGGMVATDDGEIAELVQMLLKHGGKTNIVLTISITVQDRIHFNQYTLWKTLCCFLIGEYGFLYNSQDVHVRTIL